MTAAFTIYRLRCCWVYNRKTCACYFLLTKSFQLTIIPHGINIYFFRLSLFCKPPTYKFKLITLRVWDMVQQHTSIQMVTKRRPPTLRAMRRVTAQSTMPGDIFNIRIYGCINSHTLFSGKVEKRNYTKGELHGPATITWQTGDVFEFSYKNGNMEVRLMLWDEPVIRVTML